MMLHLFTCLVKVSARVLSVKEHFIFLINKIFGKKYFETYEYLIPCQLPPKILASIGDSCLN